MTLTIDLPADLEVRLREEAARQGVDEREYVVRALRDRLPPTPPAATLPQAEAELLQRVNLGIRAETWERYHELIARRRSETLTPPEQAELIGIADEIEEANARRLAPLAELSRLRGVPLGRLMDDLGLKPAADGDRD